MTQLGRILAIKWGMNPNSSSLGVDVTFLLFGMALIYADLVARLHLFQAPGVIGGDGLASIAEMGLDAVGRMVRFERVSLSTVGVDTGLVHIAAALKRPTVELYNFATSWRTGGYWSPDVVNLGTAGQPPTLQQVKSALAGFGLL